MQSLNNNGQLTQKQNSQLSQILKPVSQLSLSPESQLLLNTGTVQPNRLSTAQKLSPGLPKQQQHQFDTPQSELLPPQHFSAKLSPANTGQHFGGFSGDHEVTNPHPLMKFLSRQGQLADQPPAAVLFNPGTEAALLQAGGESEHPDGIQYPKLAVHKVSMNKDQADQLMSFLTKTGGNVIDVELLEHHFPWLRLQNGQLPR